MLQSSLSRQKVRWCADPSAAPQINQQQYVDALRRRIWLALQSADWATATDCEERLIETEHNLALRAAEAEAPAPARAGGSAAGRRGRRAPAPGLLARPPLDDTELQAEHELVAELQRMARTIQARLHTADSPAVWQQRREQIAALRQRIRAMRARHLGGSWTSSGMTSS